MCIELKAVVCFVRSFARKHFLLMVAVMIVGGGTGRCDDKAVAELPAIERWQQAMHPFHERREAFSNWAMAPQSPFAPRKDVFSRSEKRQFADHTASKYFTALPFKGKDLSGFTKWLQKTKYDDPRSDYRVTDGMIHIGGRGMGYLATVDSYKNYHLSIEYKWGQRIDGSKYVRNSGILLHATGPDGNARGIWMASIECQLAQGCEGDLIVIRGQDKNGDVIPVTITCDTRTADDGRTRWHRGGRQTVYSGKQFWWSNHEVGFKELLDTRGKDDVASPLGEWTKVECICAGSRITIKINGITVNEC